MSAKSLMPMSELLKNLQDYGHVSLLTADADIRLETRDFLPEELDPDKPAGVRLLKRVWFRKLHRLAAEAETEIENARKETQTCRTGE